ncbi:MAG TPA: hypothetical protein ENK82_06865 [Campylobacterales bacterium]|nr:hypothetical protein [Campylobacterales bacterium]HHS93052.1 hypothetical protein [Campylobacterales bacterium]
MADQNLHDIKIDELDSPKKTSLKNILTLVALLFIIFAISVVITQLILNTDDNSTIESNTSTTTIDNVSETNSSTETKTDDKEELNSSVPTLNFKDRNITTAIKPPLTNKQPTNLTTYKEPKKSAEPKAKEPVKKTYTQPEKKAYVEKAVVKKPVTPTSKKTSYFGGVQKPVSNSYYIKVGTYKDTSSIVKKIKKNNFNYSLVKVENDTTLTRVLIGPFFSRNQAATQLDKVKANILAGAYITKAK